MRRKIIGKIITMQLETKELPKHLLTKQNNVLVHRYVCMYICARTFANSIQCYKLLNAQYLT